MAPTLSLDALAELDDLAEGAFRAPIGGGRDTPRPAPEGRAAAHGVDVLRAAGSDAVAALHALAAAADLGLALPAAAFVPVVPYVAAYLAEQERAADEDEIGEPDGATAG